MPNMGKQVSTLRDGSVPSSRPGFCVFIHSMCEGHTPSVRGDGNVPFVFGTREEAEREIADTMIDRLHEFIDGERDFDDATITEEYVVEVDVLPDGSVVCEDGRVFGKGLAPR